jgi:UDP-N-acetylglucosamine 4,6-dehydratase
MKVVDLAAAMAPDLPTEIIGIRPGEKLHEVMVTSDDARTTIELPDRYIIEPQFKFWSREHKPWAGAAPVAEGFHYSSDTNPQWLDVNGMNDLLKQYAPA